MINNTIPITCGCFVIDIDFNLLICHPTGYPMDKWTIPKGLVDENESYHDAAIRELREETNLNIYDYGYDMHVLGAIPYRNKPKMLHGFIFFLTGKITQNLTCNSYFHHKRYDVRLPEVDIIRWVNITEALMIIQPEQRLLITGKTFE